MIVLNGFHPDGTVQQIDDGKLSISRKSGAVAMSVSFSADDDPLALATELIAGPNDQLEIKLKDGRTITVRIDGKPGKERVVVEAPSTVEVFHTELTPVSLH